MYRIRNTWIHRWHPSSQILNVFFLGSTFGGGRVNELHAMNLNWDFPRWWKGDVLTVHGISVTPCCRRVPTYGAMMTEHLGFLDNGFYHESVQYIFFHVWRNLAIQKALNWINHVLWRNSKSNELVHLKTFLLFPPPKPTELAIKKCPILGDLSTNQPNGHCFFIACGDFTVKLLNTRTTQPAVC